MGNIENQVKSAKETITKPLPSPEPMKAESSAEELKERLEWGEPALTIVDVRDRDSYRLERITGAINMPVDSLVETAKDSLENNRDIYVYGQNDAESNTAAGELTAAGFLKVAQIKGGLEAWINIEGPTEGTSPNKAKADQFNPAEPLQQSLEQKS
ncbi:MAG: rhodanese-like domain-containing protein [Jaaginema sp. PMC 1080.18]|nr:rhodanese-like domain-containing protein [Jaaginema sp. PMC 1080.18]